MKNLNPFKCFIISDLPYFDKARGACSHTPHTFLESKQAKNDFWRLYVKLLHLSSHRVIDLNRPATLIKLNVDFTTDIVPDVFRHSFYR